MNLADILPLLLPKAVAWAEREALRIQAEGEALSPSESALAARMGVSHPDRIRLLTVNRLPIPDDPLLAGVAQATGLLSPAMVGMTLGYGIFICHGHRTTRLVSHECRHVHQYEQAGSIKAFLAVYLAQIAAHGYANSPLELDAYAHETDS